MMKELLAYLDELDVHIPNLNDEIDNFMKPEEKQASNAIQEVTGISLPGRGYAPETMKAPKSGNPARPGKGTCYCGLR